MTQAVNLANFANNVDSSGGLNPLALNAAVPVSRGGTGVTTSAAIASTFAAAFGNLLFPVGSIYINATNSTNPGTLLGFGTWVAFGAGRVPVGFDSTNPLFDTAEETGGSKDAVVVSHTHSVTDPGHAHNFDYAPSIWTVTGGPSTIDANRGPNNPGTTASATTGISINTTGVSGTNANYQPYITVYMWKRTA